MCFLQLSVLLITQAVGRVVLFSNISECRLMEQRERTRNAALYRKSKEADKIVGFGTMKIRYLLRAC